MKILFATDGSEYTERAARFLIRFPWSWDDSITLFHALYWIPFQYDEEFYFGTLKEIKKEIAPRILDSMLDVLKHVQANISVEIAEGSPEYCIIDTAVKSNMDMIVMGARGVNVMESALLGLGSVSRSVAIASPKPVLVIKPQAPVKSDKMKILFATDGSDYSYAAAEFLSSLPLPDNTELTILNVMRSDFLDVPERFFIEINERVKKFVASVRAREVVESEKIIEQAREYLGKKIKNIQVLSKVGDPSIEILKTRETTGADMIAVGCRGLRGMKGIMGSVSRNILTHSTCSVLIGKAC